MSRFKGTSKCFEDTLGLRHLDAQRRRGQGSMYARRRKKGKRSGNNRGKRKAVCEGMRAGNKQEGGKETERWKKERRRPHRESVLTTQVSRYRWQPVVRND